MARSSFGGGTSDFVYTVSSTGAMKVAAATLTFWSAPTGGTQYTDLLLAGAPATAIPVDIDGLIPVFTGPDNITRMWADSGGPKRIQMVASDLAGIGASGVANVAVSTSTPGAAYTVLAAHLGTVRTMILNANLTIGFDTTTPGSFGDSLILVLKQPATGGPFTVTWPGSLEWTDDAVAPGMPTAANGELLVQLLWTGSAWRASAQRYLP